MEIPLICSDHPVFQGLLEISMELKSNLNVLIIVVTSSHPTRRMNFNDETCRSMSILIDKQVGIVHMLNVPSMLIAEMANKAIGELLQRKNIML